MQNGFASVFSHISGLLSYITIPAARNAPLLAAPTKSQKWPVLVFSHGLGGTRNSYSHLLTSLASHGVFVAAPDHRDGSGPLSYIRPTSARDEESVAGSGKRSNTVQHDSKSRRIPYRHIPHENSKQVEEDRNQQLRIRLWELGLVHAALLALDKGSPMRNLDSDAQSSPLNLLEFRDTLAVHSPGCITWAGHSFGAATVVQFLKSVFYPSPAEGTCLMDLPRPSPLTDQITPDSPAALLDLWPFPLVAFPSTDHLLSRPLPCYTQTSSKRPPAVISISSEAFYNWTWCLEQTKRVIASGMTNVDAAPARMFYAPTSAHLSQSDFGILFPLMTRIVFRAEAPERTLSLNVRAVLQLMRENMSEVTGVSDPDILDSEKNSIQGWASVNPKTASRQSSIEASQAEKSPLEVSIEGEVLRSS
ncbi:MAG: hypothetical protein M1825_000590 [Sarcosagium campestre]|nr:MAG: hypothetical protein M1825_000590 [Sarcosagium campestre]